MHTRNDRVEAVVTFSGICLKIYVGPVEISVNMESQDGPLPKSFVNKRFGFKTDLALFNNPEQSEAGFIRDKITQEFLHSSEQFLYSIEPQDLIDALIFAQLKAKRTEEREKREQEKHDENGR